MWIHFNLLPTWLSLNFPAFAHGVRIAVILASAYILNRIVKVLFVKGHKRITQRMAELRGGMDPELEKRATTLSAIARKTIGAIIWVISSPVP